MKVKEFYKKINGDYDDMFERVSSDELILNFVKRFPSDTTYAQLMNAVQKADITASFEASHKLKGIAANLSFSQLYDAVSELCEQLRSQTGFVDAELVQKISKNYDVVLCEINRLEEGGCSL